MRDRVRCAQGLLWFLGLVAVDGLIGELVKQKRFIFFGDLIKLLYFRIPTYLFTYKGAFYYSDRGFVHDVTVKIYLRD